MVLREWGPAGVGALVSACCVGLGAWAVLLGRVSLVGGVKNQVQKHQEWGEHCPS